MMNFLAQTEEIFIFARKDHFSFIRTARLFVDFYFFPKKRALFIFSLST